MLHRVGVSFDGLGIVIYVAAWGLSDQRGLPYMFLCISDVRNFHSLKCRYELEVIVCIGLILLKPSGPASPSA